jgi:hypothetical protein
MNLPGRAEAVCDSALRCPVATVVAVDINTVASTGFMGVEFQSD